MLKWFENEGLVKKNDDLFFSKETKIRYTKVSDVAESNHQYTFTIPHIYIEDMLESIERLRNNVEFVENFIENWRIEKETRKYNI